MVQKALLKDSTLVMKKNDTAESPHTQQSLILATGWETQPGMIVDMAIVCLNGNGKKVDMCHSKNQSLISGSNGAQRASQAGHAG